MSLKLIPTVVAVPATGSRMSTKPRQSSAVNNVLPASDNFLPSPGRSINHAPNLVIILNRRQKEKNETHHSFQHPLMVRTTMSQRVLSSEVVSAMLTLRRVSSKFRRYTLNIVNASIIPHHVPHTSTVVCRHSGSSTVVNRASQPRTGRLMLCRSAQYADQQPRKTMGVLRKWCPYAEACQRHVASGSRNDSKAPHRYPL